MDSRVASWGLGSYSEVDAYGAAVVGFGGLVCKLRLKQVSGLLLGCWPDSKEPGSVVSRVVKKMTTDMSTHPQLL